MMRLKIKKGFSLVELIIVIAVLMVIMVAVSSLLIQMTNAATNQRRSQAAHIAEEQARMALLNIVRDVRMSNGLLVTPIPAGGFPLSLAATTPGGDTFEIRYTLTPIPAAEIGTVDAYDAGQFIVTRSFHPIPPSTFVPPPTNPVGDGPDQWSNPFSPVTVRNFTINPYTMAVSPGTTFDTRLSLDVLLWIPLIAGDAPCGCATAHTLPPPNNVVFRCRNVVSSVSVQRLP